MRFRNKVSHALTKWLMTEEKAKRSPLSNYERMRHEIHRCDVLLVEGRNRISQVIKTVTQSSWSHAALYIGRLSEIEDPIIRKQILEQYKGDLDKPLIIESVLGRGTVVSPLSEYVNEHIRICRPKGLAPQDANHVIAYCVSRLGYNYDSRQIFDLLRFLYPWSIFPRRWRSTLFSKKSSHATKVICSTLIAEAFTFVNFPILPAVKSNDETGIVLIQRNPKLFTPSDFDYSPYFEIIKYPFFGIGEAVYRKFPWRKNTFHSDEASDEIPEQFIKSDTEISRQPHATTMDSSTPLAHKDDTAMSVNNPAEKQPKKRKIFRNIFRKSSSSIK